MKTIKVNTKKKKDNFFKKVNNGEIELIAPNTENEKLILCGVRYTDKNGTFNIRIQQYDFSKMDK